MTTFEQFQAILKQRARLSAALKRLQTAQLDWFQLQQPTEDGWIIWGEVQP